MKYVIIDGQLQRDSSATRQWSRRASRVVPSDPEEPKDALALPREDRRTLAEVIEGLDEIPES